jgi:putative aldouronate transport system substrate-binding protein
MKEMQDYLGVNLDITWNNINYREWGDITNVYMASGEFDDVFIARDLYQITDLGKAGLLVELSQYSNITPYYNKWLDSNNNKAKIILDGEHYYQFAEGEQGFHWGNQQVPIYRQDAFEANGIKIPETQDEFYEAAKRIKEIYPESYPIGSGISSGDNNYNAASMFFLVNKTFRTFYYDGENYVFPPVDNKEAYYKTLEFGNKLYTEGLLDPEYRTHTGDQGIEYMLNGRHFMVPGFWTGESGRVNNAGVDTNVKWAYAPRPLSYKGELGWKPGSQWEGYKLLGGSGSVISSKSKYIELLVKMLDYQYSDEMVSLVNWGIEGITYNIVDGKKQFIDEILDNPAPRSAIEPYGMITSATNFTGIRAPDERQAWSGVFKQIPVFAEGKFFFYPDIWKFTNDYERGHDSVFPNEIAPPINLTTDEMDQRANIVTPLETEINEAVMSFVSGRKSLAEFDAWVDSLKNIADYEALKAMYNEKYDAAESAAQ